MYLSSVVLAAITATAVTTPTHAMDGAEPHYLPTGAAAKLVSVTTEEGSADAGMTVVTQALAIKETGPQQTVARFGEVYVFLPSLIIFRRDQPTAVSFWNLQPDDDHDFMLVAPDLTVLMHVQLPALQKPSYVFTFHREGLFTFYCTMHQPAMSGQLLVLPPAPQ